MTRPIRWDIIEHNYDQLVKYATAIRVGTASTEAILRRFTRNASHPVYQAMLELGRAQKTIFIARTGARTSLAPSTSRCFRRVSCIWTSATRLSSTATGSSMP